MGRARHADIVSLLGEQLGALAARIHGLGRGLLAWHRQDAARQRLVTLAAP